LVSIARPDEGENPNTPAQFVYAIEPESPEEIFKDTKDQPIIAASSLPSIYDGIYRTALSEGLTPELAGSLIKILAFDVDFKSRVSPTDSLEVFLSLEGGQEVPTEESEILYAAIKLGKVTRRYYRFGDNESGIVDYYDDVGKSSKKFLLRKPVPNGKFRSAYGMRRHPISRRYKLHGGVDWSAPRGTPIIAAGNGVIEKAGWSSGYGKQTIIRHANGYETSYSHQTAYAKGIRPGARVRQGQVIGFVGSTGYSTGPHLHYEVKVNGNRVDPMRIRLPKGKVLKDEELSTFLAEKTRIDQLVNPGSAELALN
jgi:murein DD-endopeptidase MepM/ murein hydrolase activator NlpD